MSNWRASRTRVDDSLDVFSCHGVSGIWGSIATGFFATVFVNPGAVNGLLYGNSGLVASQVIAVLVVAAYSFVGSFLLLKLINVFSPLRVSPEEEEQGLDLAEYGEEAYVQQG